MLERLSETSIDSNIKSDIRAFQGAKFRFPVFVEGLQDI